MITNEVVLIAVNDVYNIEVYINYTEGDLMVINNGRTKVYLSPSIRQMKQIVEQIENL